MKVLERNHICLDVVGVFRPCSLAGKSYSNKKENANWPSQFRAKRWGSCSMSDVSRKKMNMKRLSELCLSCLIDLDDVKKVYEKFKRNSRSLINLQKYGGFDRYGRACSEV